VKFLSEIEEVLPWQALIDLIESSYPKTSKKGGLEAHALETHLSPAGDHQSQTAPGRAGAIAQEPTGVHSRDEALKLWATRRQEGWRPCKPQW